MFGRRAADLNKAPLQFQQSRLGGFLVALGSLLLAAFSIDLISLSLCGLMGAALAASGAYCAFLGLRAATFPLCITIAPEGLTIKRYGAGRRYGWRDVGSAWESRGITVPVREESGEWRFADLGIGYWRGELYVVETLNEARARWGPPFTPREQAESARLALWLAMATIVALVIVASLPRGSNWCAVDANAQASVVADATPPPGCNRRSRYS
ncbi:MAG TPA: hypothetical protein VGB49_02670 [Caulobacteraceae bacterium]